MSAASSASAFVGRVLIVSNNAVAIGQIKDSLQRFALFPEQCPKLSLALAGCGKTRLEADAVPQNSLVSTAQPDKKKECVEKTSNSWMCSAT
jgi:hypothetical protein